MTLPAGPRSPSAVQTWQWLRRPTDFMEACHARYGEIFTVRPYWDGTLVMTSNPEAIRQVLAFGYEEVGQDKSKEFTALLGRSSLFILEGQEHFRVRSMAMPAFSFGRMQGMASVIQELTEEVIDRWPLGVSFGLQDAMHALSLEVVLHALLGQGCPARLRRVSHLFTAASAAIADPFMLIPIDYQRRIGGPWPRFVSIVAEAGRIFLDEIRERRARGAPPGPDVLSMLLRARDPAGTPMTEGEIRDTLIALLAAGPDTAGSEMSWAMHCLLREPALCARLREELSGAREGRTLCLERVMALPLLNATVREVLRLHPVFPGIRRDLSAPVRLLGHDLPAGTRVVACIYLAQRRPEVFPEPERFLPERFLQRRPLAGEWLPFGGGMRRCVGSALALIQLKVILATILGRAVLRPVPGPPVRTVRRFLALSPSGGLPAVLLSRSPRERAARPRPAYALA